MPSVPMLRPFIFFFFFLLSTTLGSAQNSSFSEDGSASYHPEANRLPDDAPCTDCVEIISQRKENERIYRKTDGLGKKIIIEKANGPLNYLDSNGYWRDISPTPRYIATENALLADEQKHPVKIDLNTLGNGIRIANKWIRFNENTRFVYKGNTEDSLVSDPVDFDLNLTKNGLIANSPDGKMQLSYTMEIGGVKSNLHLLKKDALPNEEGRLLWKSNLRLPPGYTFEKGSGKKDEKWSGEYIIKNEKGRPVIRIEAPLIYDAEGAIMTDGYEYNLKHLASAGRFELTLECESSWFKNPLRKFPVTLDPLIAAVDSSTGTIGFEPSGFCFDPNDFCSNILSVTVPGKSTLVAARTTVRLRTINGGCSGACDPQKAGFRIYGPCNNRYVPNNSFFSPPNATAFDHIFADIDLFNNINCLPFSCPDHQLNFDMHTFSCSCPADQNCGTACHRILPGDWKVVVEARTLEAYIFEGDSLEVCFGETVSFNSRASYGVPPYSFFWTPDNVTTPNGSSYPVFADTFTTLRVEDACGTIVRDTTFIKVNPLPEITFTDIIPACKGQNSGEATAVVTNGLPPYNFLWSTSPPQNTARATGLAPGWYQVTVSNAKGCSNIDSVEITQPANALDISVSGKDISCNSGNDGSATVNINSGNPPYDITWSTGAKSTSIMNLTAGYYSVTVSDASGCIDTGGILIRNTGNINIILQVDSITCHGDANGSIRALVSGDAPPFSYIWNTGSKSDQISGLAPGSYSVTVSDSNNCMAVSSAVLTEPDSLVIIIISYPESCIGGGNNGMAVAQVTGGTPPYSFIWNSSPNQYNDTAFNLKAGVYVVTVVDQNLCRATATARIDPPANYQISFDTIPVSCFGGHDGSATVHVRGGMKPYSFQWNVPGGSSDSTVSGLSAGFYNVTISDAGNCSIVRNIQITQPVEIQVNVIASNVSCPGLSDGEVTVIPSGGTPPYAYLWNTPGGDQTQSVSGLPAGNYELYITDSKQCRDTFFITIGTPDSIKSTVLHKDPDCPGRDNGMIAVAYQGGRPPLSIFWEGPYPARDTLVNLPQGLYIYTIRDGNGCTLRDSIRLNYITHIEVIAEIDSETCVESRDGRIALSINGAANPVTFQWNTGDTQAVLDSLRAGSYAVTIVDSKGCQVDSQFVISLSDSISLDLGTDTLIESGATIEITPSIDPPGNYTYEWWPATGLSDTTSATVLASPSSDTRYYLRIRNSKSCRAIDSILIAIRPNLIVGLPNAFSPNGDGNNDLFFEHPTVDIKELSIYNRWGSLIYKSSSPWDGRLANGLPAPAAMYVYHAILQYPGSEFQFEVDGYLLLLR